MLDFLQLNRKPIGMMIFAIVAVAAFATVSWPWLLALPFSLVLGLVAHILWVVILGVLERAHYDP